MLLLLQTIRPSKYFLGLEIPITDGSNNNNENYVMFYGESFPSELNDYVNKIGGFNPSLIKENCEKTHFITLQLVKRKYQFYRWAVSFIKFLVLWIAIGIIVLLSYQYFLTCS